MSLVLSAIDVVEARFFDDYPFHFRKHRTTHLQVHTNLVLEDNGTPLRTPEQESGDNMSSFSLIVGPQLLCC
jgi:hypothetical protein